MIKIISFIIASLFLSIVLKNSKSNLSVLVTVVAAVLLITLSINTLLPTIEFISSLSQKINFDNGYLKIILKCIAICYLGNFCSNLCKDSGESTLAYSSEIVCKCMVVSLSLPIYMDVFKWILKLWEST